MPRFGEPRSLTAGPGTDLRTIWTPDSQAVVFERLSGQVRRLYRLTLDGTDLREVPLDETPGHNTTGRAAFRDPEAFVFVSDREGPPALFQSVAGRVSLLLSGPAPCHGPALPPDGQGPLLFFQQPSEDEAFICSLDESGQVNRLTQAPGVQDQPWPLADGQGFIYHGADQDGHRLYRQALVPGALRECLSAEDESTPYVTPFPSPDGRWLAFTSALSGQEQIWVMDLQDRTRAQVTSGDPHSFPAWSPDGQFLVCTQGQPTARSPHGHLVLLSVEG
ncbi:hypothetical protein GO986_05000 [Deinococcus sp. HMF7620]|uniref:Biopolymer transporter Tol n=1 Tax=Deinococcus arboris TaxID=2682977 RepID=A0A7C9LM36_9DEIO|nr:hypothetical protein [Deinococcus arboris]